MMLGSCREKIHDNRFLRLMRNMLQAGYLEDWIWNATLSGAPQGGVVSPILSNIYLHRLDEFVETVLIPEYTRGEHRARNPAYREVSNAMPARSQTRRPRTGTGTAQAAPRACPAATPGSRLPAAAVRPVRRRHLLGFTGPKAEAEEIKARLAAFLRDDLKLELSQDKTLITHARTGAARFLGYEITVQHNDRKATSGKRVGQRRRSRCVCPWT